MPCGISRSEKSTTRQVDQVLCLQPGTYTVVAELQGFSKYQRIGVDVRTNLSLNLDVVMTVGSLQETVTVSGDAPMLEVEKPTQAMNISGEMQRQLPLNNKRAWDSFLQLVPAVTSRTTDSGGGVQVYMLRGGSVEGHAILLDGADVGSWRQSRPDYVQFSTDAIEDVQIKTAAIDASAPLSVGVVVNTATKSGTNVFKGSVGVVGTPRGWNGNNADAGGSSSATTLFQSDASIGGPVIRNKVFFFGAGRYSRLKTGVFRDAAQVNCLQALVPGFEAFDSTANNR